MERRYGNHVLEKIRVRRSIFSLYRDGRYWNFTLTPRRVLFGFEPGASRIYLEKSKNTLEMESFQHWNSQEERQIYA